MGQGVWRPISDKGKDQEIYCVEPGVLLKISGLNREQVEAYDGQVCERGCGQCASWGDAKFSSVNMLDSQNLVTHITIAKEIT